MISPKHIAWLIFLMNLVVISSIDIYIPAAPYLGHVFDVSDSAMKLTFLASPFFSSFGGIPFGRFSDRFGRRRFLFAGMTLYIVGSGLCMVANGIEMFFIGRCIQSLGTGGLSVLSGAILADIFTGATLARYMGIFASLYPVVFALAPIIGAEVLERFGWRYIFALITFGMIFISVLFYLWVPETNSIHEKKQTDQSGVAGMRTLLTSLPILLLVSIHSLPISFNGIFTVNSPFIYIDVFMMTPREFSYLQAMPVATQFMGAYIYKSIVERIGLIKSLKFGMVTSIFFVLVAGLMAFDFIPDDPYLIIAVVSIFSLGSTFMISSASTMILDGNPGNKGLTMSYISLMRNLFMIVIIGLTSSLSYREVNPILMYLIATAVIQVLLIHHQIKERHV